MDIDSENLTDPEKWILLKHGQRITWWAGISWREIGLSLGGRFNRKYNDDKTLEFYWQFFLFYGEFHVELERKYWAI